jgi:DNA helicase HerA-like ATPase
LGKLILKIFYEHSKKFISCAKINHSINSKIMSQKEDFIQTIVDGYTSKGESIILGAAILDGETVGELQVKIPLKTLNRHGLIAGATGTGKTKTIQVLSEQLSSFGIPVLMMDIKGDFSGIAKEGEEKPFITERMQNKYSLHSFKFSCRINDAFCSKWC